LGDLPDARALYEAEQSAILGKDGITPEISEVIADLDMDGVIAAGGIADYLRGLIVIKQKALEADVRSTAAERNFVLDDASVARIVKEMEVDVIGPYKTALNFVEKK
jgi:hypothetical protein